MSLTAPMAASSCLRSRSSACAFLASFQSDGSSESVLSSSSRLSARSQSKKPPQQHERLLDFLGDGGDFGTHGGKLRTFDVLPIRRTGALGKGDLLWFPFRQTEETS